MTTEKKVKIKVIMATIYGIITWFLGIITAGCVDGTVTVTTTSNVAIAGILFGILSIIEIEKAIKIAKNTSISE